MEMIGFERSILSHVGYDHFEKYGYLLSSIKECFRERFISTLQSGFNIPTAYDQINIGAKLPEVNYKRYINFISSKFTYNNFATY
jgi:hypothetical protein